MQYKIINNPMGMLVINMNKDEEITAEAGSLVYLKGDIEIKTRMRNKGLLKSLKVTVLGGETFFVNDYIAHEDNSILGLTGPPVGDICQIKVDSYGYIVQAGAYIASTKGIELDTQWQGFTKGIFGTELFMLKATGKGDLFVNSYGSIIEDELKGGEKMLLDNYHLVALSANAEYKVVKVGGLKTTILGGEGLATEITGPAKVYYQTKNLKELIDLLGVRAREETQGRGLSIGGFRV
ncbi:MAG: TIGR00266 family protein [Candidatus Nitrosocaldaceae archaeon]